eukprot:TRINITY_DN763_c0_g1_i2.p1 TRINITY_DN763_c0_g1~~TRINITY_DN763_c0_g1_i2.p1  ORF type:complete len:172 (+),score=19.47 TRINITY_DN763_c0_g1_i2:61-576(+)
MSSGDNILFSKKRFYVSLAEATHTPLRYTIECPCCNGAVRFKEPRHTLKCPKCSAILLFDIKKEEEKSTRGHEVQELEPAMPLTPEEFQRMRSEVEAFIQEHLPDISKLRLQTAESLIDAYDLLLNNRGAVSESESSNRKKSRGRKRKRKHSRKRRSQEPRRVQKQPKLSL